VTPAEQDAADLELVRRMQEQDAAGKVQWFPQEEVLQTLRSGKRTPPPKGKK